MKNPEFRNLSSINLNCFIIGLILLACSSVPTKTIVVDYKFTRLINHELTSDSSSFGGASWIDFNNDGLNDLYLSAGYNVTQSEQIPFKNLLYQNLGNGHFKRVTYLDSLDGMGFSSGSSWADSDNDGYLDVFIPNQINQENFYLINSSEGFHASSDKRISQDQGNSFASMWVDINNDGLIDLHVMNGSLSKPERDFIYKNEGHHQFSKIELPFSNIESSSGGAAWGDFDNDGDLDVFIPINAMGHPNLIYRNEGDWNFTDMSDSIDLSNEPFPASPKSLVAHWIDIDNDLDLDLFVGNYGGYANYLFRNEGNYNFTKIMSGDLVTDASQTNDATWEDFDNDGDIDVLVAPWGGGAVLYTNDGFGTLNRTKSGDLGQSINLSSGVSAQDYDNDGDLDVYITHWPISKSGKDSNQLYRNDFGAINNWLKIKLIGTESNRSAIGAKIILTIQYQSNQLHQLRVVNSHNGWRSSNGLTQHFGLGKVTEIKKIEVMWPSGNSDVINNINGINQLITIKENNGIAN